jgi:hypothetical protein
MWESSIWEDISRYGLCLPFLQMDNKLQHNNSVLKLHMTFVADTNDSKKEDLTFTRGTLCSNATTIANFTQWNKLQD